MRKLTAIAVILLAATISGCSGTPQQQFKQVSEQKSPNGRLTVVDGPLEVGLNKIWIIRDKETGREFIFTGGSDRVAICPVPDKAVEK